MKGKVNLYFAILIITIAGIGAAFLIIRIANTNASSFSKNNETQYKALQQSILGQ